MRFAVFRKLLSVGSTSAQEDAAPDTDLPTAQNLQAIVQIFQLLSVLLHTQLQISSSYLFALTSCEARALHGQAFRHW